MAPAENVDELFDVRNAYFTGNYQTCINEAQKLKVSEPALALEKDVLMYRSYLALRKYRVVLDDIKQSSPELLHPLRQLAQFLSSPAQRDSIVADIDTKMSGSFDPGNYVLLLVAGTIYLHASQPESALKVLHASDHLECIALRIQALLSMSRADLARKELKNMTDKDEDATITQLAQAWTNLALGGEKIQEAYYIYQDMIDKQGSTAVLLNGQAVSFIAQGKYPEAEAALSEALEKDPNNPETLVNLIVLSQLTGKQPEVSNRYLSQLKDMDSNHPYVVSLNQKEMDFDRMCKQYAISA
jgi:coatomer protein complex subunit epsilon